jgi:hypothetical protein
MRGFWYEALIPEPPLLAAGLGGEILAGLGVVVCTLAAGTPCRSSLLSSTPVLRVFRGSPVPEDLRIVIADLGVTGLVAVSRRLEDFCAFAALSPTKATITTVKPILFIVTPGFSGRFGRRFTEVHYTARSEKD